MVLLGYIPVTKLECMSPGACQGAAYQLFHHCMSVILKPLVEAGKNGVDIICADNQIQKVYLILASYIADFPEQCLVAAVKESDCLICKIDPDLCGESSEAPFRDSVTSLEALKSWGTPEELEAFTQMGLCLVSYPFGKNPTKRNI